MKLDSAFFARSPQTVAKELLGCFLVRKTGEGRIVGRIIETEAYGDASDLASHARFGVTKRNKIMYDKAGLLYVYHIYGIFYLTNIVCEDEGKAGAVLIRSCEIIEGKEIAHKNLERSKFVKSDELQATGPGKLSLAFGLTKEQNYLDLATSEEFSVEKGDGPSAIIETERVGVDYAGHCRMYNWRYYIEKSKFVSKR